MLNWSCLLASESDRHFERILNLDRIGVPTPHLALTASSFEMRMDSLRFSCSPYFHLPTVIRAGQQSVLEIGKKMLADLPTF